MAIVKRRKPKGPSENQIQAAYFAWCNALSRKYPALELVFHIPNGSHKSPAARGLFKAIGLKSGVPDVFLPVPMKKVPGLWIEFKSEKGKLSESQMWWHDRLAKQGYKVITCKSWTDAANATLNYLGLKQEARFNDHATN